MSNSQTSSTQKMLNIWAIILIAWSFYRATFKLDLPLWFDEFIAKPFVFLIPLFWFITKTEKISFFKGVGLTKKNILADILFGIGMGGVFIGIAVFTRMAKGIPLPQIQITSESVMWVLATFMAAGMEQILSTGFVFKRLSEESKGIFKPLIFAALLFFFLHVPVLFGADKISGATLMQMMVMNTAVSLTTSVVYLMRKSTVAPILVYALYLLSLPILL